jgi:hypothetical protein
MVDESAFRQLLIDSCHSSAAAEKFFRCHLDNGERFDAWLFREAIEAADREG